jgi:predicted transcriptional regulator
MDVNSLTGNEYDDEVKEVNRRDGEMSTESMYFRQDSTHDVVSTDNEGSRLNKGISWAEVTINRDNGEFPRITIEEEVDFLESARRFCKRDIMIIAKILEPSSKKGIGISLGYIREKTGLSTNQINHTLIEMENRGYVKAVGKQRSKLYYLTKYGQIIYHAMEGAMQSIERETSDISTDED